MTLVVTHNYVSTRPVGTNSTRIYSDSWNANHQLTGTVDASQLNANVVQAVVNDTNVTGTIAAQTLTLGWTGTTDATRLNANVVQAITQDTNVRGAIAAQTLTFSWLGQLGLSRGGTNADLSATGGAANYLKQASVGAAVTVGTIPASDIASGAALTQVNDTNVTLALGGTPATAALKATSFTMGWTGTLSIARGGTGAGTQQAAFDALAPTATRAGDLTYWNGTHYVNLAGNNSGTKVLQEDASGVPSWVTVAGTGTVTSSGAPVVGQIPKFTTATDIAGFSFTVTPQGRLTLTSATPVLTSTVSAQTTIFYTPYVGQVVPIYDGTTMIPTVFSELSQTTTDATKSPAAVAASKPYDMFVWNDSGTIRCTRGPAWTNDTTRGYTLTMVQGILLNTSIITNGPAASRGTWVGTVRSNGSSQIDYILGGSASGGTAGFLGVRNYYNRVMTTVSVVDSGATYTYSSSTIRQARASAGNQTTFISFGDDAIFCSYVTENSLISAANGFANSGIGLDSTVGYSSPRSLVYNVSSTANMVLGGAAVYTVTPSLGVHFVSGNQASDGTNLQVFDNNSKDTLSTTLMN